jgi:predicted lipoprotein with Yx(FWY)xxD motif
VRRSITVTALAVVTAVLLAACGASSKTKTAAPTTVAESTTTALANASVGVVADPKLGSILVDAAGRTLYRFTKETNGSIACTGACISTWPPFLAPLGGPPSSRPGVGTLTTVTRPDGGVQVAYNGSPLYHYAADTKAGDTNGQGVGGVWFVVTPAIAAQAAVTTTPAARATATTRSPATTARPGTTNPPATSPPATSPPATNPPTTMYHPPTTSCAYPPCY